MLLQLKQNHFGNGLKGFKDPFPCGSNSFEPLDLAGIQQLIHLLNRYDIRKVSLIVLDYERKFFELIALFCKVYLEVIKALHIRLHPFYLAVSNKYDAVNAFKNELSAGRIKDLSGYGIKVKSYLEAFDVTQG